MTPAEMVRYHERRATKAEAELRAVALLHHPHGRRGKTCDECGQSYPCRTALLAGGER